MERGNSSQSAIGGGRNESPSVNNRRTTRGQGVAHLEHLRLQNLANNSVNIMPSSHHNTSPIPTVNESYLANSTPQWVLVYAEREPLQLLPLFDPPEEEWGYWKDYNDEKIRDSTVQSLANMNTITVNHQNGNSADGSQKIDLDLKLSL